MSKRNHWYDYLWVLTALFLALGFFNILFLAGAALLFHSAYHGFHLDHRCRTFAGAQTAANAASQFYNGTDTIGHADRLKRTGLSTGAAGYTIFLFNLRITLATLFIASPTRFILTLL